jgi:four helix bundle protein
MPNSSVVRSHKDLIVWQKAMNLVEEIYQFTEHLPKSEKFNLIQQMQRSAVSIPSNIAEGRRRGSMDDCKRFYQYAFASGAELETQIEITKRLPFGKELNYTSIDSLLTEVMKMLNRMTQ